VIDNDASENTDCGHRYTATFVAAPYRGPLWRVSPTTTARRVNGPAPSPLRYAYAPHTSGDQIAGVQWISVGMYNAIVDSVIAIYILFTTILYLFYCNGDERGVSMYKMRLHFRHFTMSLGIYYDPRGWDGGFFDKLPESGIPCRTPPVGRCRSVGDCSCLVVTVGGGWCVVRPCTTLLYTCAPHRPWEYGIYLRLTTRNGATIPISTTAYASSYAATAAITTLFGIIIIITSQSWQRRELASRTVAVVGRCVYDSTQCTKSRPLHLKFGTFKKYLNA